MTRTIQKALLFRLEARITSLITRFTAPRILGPNLGYQIKPNAVEAKHRFHPFPTQNHENNTHGMFTVPVCLFISPDLDVYRAPNMKYWSLSLNFF
jgi:hypothetical protein